MVMTESPLRAPFSVSANRGHGREVFELGHHLHVFFDRLEFGMQLLDGQLQLVFFILGLANLLTGVLEDLAGAESGAENSQAVGSF